LFQLFDKVESLKLSHRWKEYTSIHLHFYLRK
jgi:hypothetical protein